MLAPFRSRGLTPYAVGIASVVVATLLRYLVDAFLGEHLSFSFYFLAVAVTAWIGGVWPALLTALLSSLAGNYFFTHTRGSLSIDTQEELFSLLLFIAVCTVIGLLSEISLRALERAKVAERAKDDFIAAVAHELRSPLSAIQYANTFQRVSGDEEAKEHSDLIERQVQQLDTLIEDLLDLSRVGHGKIRLQRQHVNASSVVDGAIEKARPLIESHKHSLTFDISPEPMPLEVDPQRMEQVLANLLTNAAKYTLDGGEIVICAKPEVNSIVFSVRDNGIGISPEILPRVFDLFTQAERSRERHEGGLGIGLALVRKITEMHGGTVRAESAGKNRGSEFTVTLPLEQPAAASSSVVGL